MNLKKSPEEGKMLLGMVLFNGFQLLDVFGPLDVFGFLSDRVEIVLIGENGIEAKSSAGPVVKLNCSFSKIPDLDILMIPGGAGSRREVSNITFLKMVRSAAEATPHVASICTGAAILAKTGILDGKRATTNKRAYQWATSQSNQVHWIFEARWVEDGKFFTSSGVSAGIDMAYALVSKIFGNDLAVSIALRAEYIWKNEPNIDPFAKEMI